VCNSLLTHLLLLRSCMIFWLLGFGNRSIRPLHLEVLAWSLGPGTGLHGLVYSWVSSVTSGKIQGTCNFWTYAAVASFHIISSVLFTSHLWFDVYDLRCWSCCSVNQDTVVRSVPWIQRLQVPPKPLWAVVKFYVVIIRKRTAMSFQAAWMSEMWCILRLWKGRVAPYKMHVCDPGWVRPFSSGWNRPLCHEL